ncbi:hypothetical protein MMC22_004316 [Lobaria immixta]|nr:hypothetical protein [Lobaria immixta]
MRFLFLSILLLFVCSPSSFGFTTDVFYIETVIADSVIFLDTYNFKAFAGVYTKEITFGASSLNLPTLNSSQQLIDQGYKLFTPSVVLQNAITTQRVAFVGPTDEDYAFTKAKAITYLTTTFFGTGNLTGQIAAIYSRLDDSLVKTSLPEYGGKHWQFRGTAPRPTSVKAVGTPYYDIRREKERDREIGLWVVDMRKAFD